MPALFEIAAAAVPSAGQDGVRPTVLYVSLMHPDFLPSIYSVAHVLTEEGYGVRIVSFESPAPGRFPVNTGIGFRTCGEYRGSLLRRAQARTRFRNAVRLELEAERPVLVMAACPFSFLEAIRALPATTPIIYQAFETYPASPSEFRRSPLSAIRNWRALRQLRRAALVCTPSPERSGWLMAYAGLRSLPATVLNVPSWLETEQQDRTSDEEVALPLEVAGKHVVINTGNVNATQATLELVESVATWPDDACLVVTNVGETPYARSIREARQRSRRRSDIILLPLVSRAAMRWLQRRAVIGVCLMRTTSSLEAVMPAPNKVGEYLHSGLMIVGNRIPYLERLALHRVVEIAESFEPNGLSAAVTQALAKVRDSDPRPRVRELARLWYCMEVQARPILSALRAASPIRDSAAI